MRKSKNIKSKNDATFTIVVDGQTEYWYLEMLKRNERNLRVNIKPELPSKKSLAEQFKLLCDLSRREYEKVFWVVDFDVILKETREAAKGKITALQEFTNYRNQLHEEFENVVVIVNNPCLEFWILLHFENTTRSFEDCSKAESQLKKHLNDYEKTQKYFTKQDNDIYLKLKPHLKAALQRASKLGTFDKDEPANALCEMPALFNAEQLKTILEQL